MTTAFSIHQLVSLSHDVAGWIFTWSWQMLLLLAAAWLALKLDRSRSATLRYRIWLIALLMATALPLLNVICARLPGPIVPAALPVINTAVSAPPVTVSAPAPGFWWPSLGWPILIIFWATGAIVSLTRLAGAFWKLRAVKGAARPLGLAGSIAGLDHQASGLMAGDGRTVWVGSSNVIQAPGLAGLFRPVILLPADIDTWTTLEERTSILRHEFAHIKRRDHVASLFQSILKALFFFHPMLRYACNQLSLEMELACDDRVLAVGTEPRAYAESILKAAERSFLSDVVHQTAAFASKRKLERRIDMILDPNRTLWRSRLWPFLVLPLVLMGIITWLVMPAASGRRLAADSGSGQGTGLPASSGLASNRQSQAEPVVDRQTIWLDTVKRGPLVLLIRALGNLKQDSDGRFLADMRIPEVMMRDVEVGLPASIDTRMGVIAGKVFHIHGRPRDGVVRVDIILESEVPAGAGSGLPVEARIEIGRLDDVVYVGRPVHGQSDSTVSLFKAADDEMSATRVQVRFGRASANSIQIIDGLKPGDKVIISDMSAYDFYDKITLK